MLEKPGPDIFLSSLTAIYDPGSDLLVIGGSAWQFTLPDATQKRIYFGNGTQATQDLLADFSIPIPLPGPGYTGYFMLNATVDGNGVFSTGEFAVVGYLASDPGGAPDPSPPATVTLLRGTITEMHSTAFDVGKIDFVAKSLSSDIAGMKDLFGGQVGIKFNANYAPNSSQAISFSNFIPVLGNGSGDLGRPVPEPASMAVWASALMLGVTVRRRRTLALAV